MEGMLIRISELSPSRSVILHGYLKSQSLCWFPKSLDDNVCGELGLKFGSLSDNCQEKWKENAEILVWNGSNPKMFSPVGLSWNCKRKTKGSDSSLLWWDKVLLCNLYSFSTFLDSKIYVLSTSRTVWSRVNKRSPAQKAGVYTCCGWWARQCVKKNSQEHPRRVPLR